MVDRLVEALDEGFETVTKAGFEGCPPSIYGAVVVHVHFESAGEDAGEVAGDDGEFWN